MLGSELGEGSKFIASDLFLEYSTQRELLKISGK